MPVCTVCLFILCMGIWFAGAHLTRAQEATSANLPDQFQTGEMIQIHKPKKKKGGASSKTVATAVKQDTAPVPEEMTDVEEAPTQIESAIEKKIKPNRKDATVSTSPRSESTTTPPNH